MHSRTGLLGALEQEALMVFDEPPASRRPSEGALDHPALWQQDDAFFASGSLTTQSSTPCAFAAYLGLSDDRSYRSNIFFSTKRLALLGRALSRSGDRTNLPPVDFSRLEAGACLR